MCLRLFEVLFDAGLYVEVVARLVFLFSFFFFIHLDKLAKSLETLLLIHAVGQDLYVKHVIRSVVSSKKSIQSSSTQVTMNILDTICQGKSQATLCEQIRHQNSLKSQCVQTFIHIC